MIWVELLHKLLPKNIKKVRSLTIISSKSEDIVHGFTKLMIEHQDKVAGFNKSEALLILFPYIYKKVTLQ